MNLAPRWWEGGDRTKRFPGPSTWMGSGEVVIYNKIGKSRKRIGIHRNSGEFWGMTRPDGQQFGFFNGF